MRMLMVDDDPGLRALVRATFDDIDIQIVEADSAAAARAAIADQEPDVIVLDVVMPRESGLELSRELKSSPNTAMIPIVLLSGSADIGERRRLAARADAYLPKPFSPLHLLSVVERLAGSNGQVPLGEEPPAEGADAQLLMYARDLRRLLDLERAQRRLLEHSYSETVEALSDALATKDTGTSAHSQRVRRYALEFARAIDPALGEDPGVEYGFLLHDVGKIGIPDSILGKPDALTDDERRQMQQHPVLGEQMLHGVAFLQGEGLGVVRWHHERWDGGGYPDGLGGTEIPVAARVFAVADTLDAMTTARPYRPAGSWAAAGREIVAQQGLQFDPAVVKVFAECEPKLRRVRREVAAA